MKKVAYYLFIGVIFIGFNQALAQEKGKGKSKSKVKQEVKAEEKGGKHDHKDHKDHKHAKGKKHKAKKAKAHGPPPWAPAHGYRKRFVYFPKHETYYDNDKGVYISKDKETKKWTVSVDIPKILKNVDLKKETKVEIDHEGDAPQSDHTKIKKKFPIGFKIQGDSPGK